MAGLALVEVLLARRVIEPAEVAAAARVPSPPLPWGNYDVFGEAGRGVHGVVFWARRRSDGAHVVVKALRAASAGADAPRLLREARLLARLDHPGIVRLLDAGEEDGAPWLVTEALPGGTLADLGPRPPLEALWYASRVASALAHAHAAGVIHRDLKPSNVLLDASGSPRVVDFGLARDAAGVGDLTGSGALLGSLGYAAPEQVGGAKKADAKADVWALGALLHALLTGHPPYADAPTLGAWLARARSGFPGLGTRGGEQATDLTALLDGLLADALRIDPRERPDMAAYARALTFVAAAAQRR
jgi:serine/threonine protein kinase